MSTTGVHGELPSNFIQGGSLGCENVETETAPIYVSGQVALVTALRLTDAPEKKADKVVGYKLPKMNDGWRQMPDVKVVDLAADGSFKFPFSKDERSADWVLVLLDSKQAAIADRFVGFVGISDGGDGMIRFPMPSAQADIGLVTVTPPDQGFDTALSQSTLDDVTKSFTIDKAASAQIAKTDSVLRNVKNAVLNVDVKAKTFAMATPAYTWNMTGGHELQDDVSGVPPSLADTAGTGDVAYTGDFKTNDGFIAKDKFCNGDTAVHIVPPNDTAIEDEGAHVYETFSNSGTAIVDSGTGSCGFGPNGGGLTGSAIGNEFRVTIANNLQFQADPEPPIPAGFWSLEAKRQGDADFSQRAAFDLAATSPFVKQGSSLVPLMFVPTAHVLFDGDQKVTGIEVKFWYHDGTKMTQLDDLRKLFADGGGGLIDLVHFYYDDFAWNCDGTNNAYDAGKRCSGGANINLKQVEALQDKSVIVVTDGLAKGWKYRANDDGGGDPPVLDMDRFSMNYEVAGVAYSWTWQ